MLPIFKELPCPSVVTKISREAENNSFANLPNPFFAPDLSIAEN